MNIRLIGLINLIALIGLIGLIGIASATSKADIVHPVVELGNCKDEASCRSYCEKPENMNACLDFAEKHNLMSAQEIKMARAMGSKPGPGGCLGQQCETYCNNPDHMVACMEFALNDPAIRATLLPEEIEEMPKVLTALKSGAKMPGGCSGRECRDYCMKPPNRQAAQECFRFAKEANFIPPNVPEEMAILVMTEGGPGGCHGEDCEKVCSENPKPCIKWMKDHGMNPLDMMPSEAKAMFEQIPAAMRPCVEEKIQAGEMDSIPECFMGMMGAGGGFGPPGGGFPPGFGPPGGMPGDMEDMMDMMMGGGDDDFDDEGDEDEEDEEGFHGGFPSGGMPGGFPGGIPGGMPSGGFTGMPQLPGGCQPGPDMMPCIIKYCTENWQKQDPICQMGPGGPSGGFPAGLPPGQPTGALPLRSFLGNVLETLLGFLF